MSTYTHTDYEGSQLSVRPSTWPDRALVEAPTCTLYVSKADAPRVALEILKAAGWKANDGGDRMGHALANLTAHIKDLEAAADKARLDQEADTLRVTVADGLLTWDDLHGSEREHWRNVALAARELHKDGNK